MDVFICQETILWPSTHTTKSLRACFDFQLEPLSEYHKCLFIHYEILPQWSCSSMPTSSKISHRANPKWSTNKDFKNGNHCLSIKDTPYDRRSYRVNARVRMMCPTKGHRSNQGSQTCLNEDIQLVLWDSRHLGLAQSRAIMFDKGIFTQEISSKQPYIHKKTHNQSINLDIMPP